MPPYLSDDFRDCARALRDADHKGHQNFRLWHAAGGERMWKEWVRACLANVAFIDDQVGRVLGALERSTHARNTIIVFTSDHGFHMGEKDWLFKNSLWEESCRVPLIVVAPGTATACARFWRTRTAASGMVRQSPLRFSKAATIPSEGRNGATLFATTARKSSTTTPKTLTNGPISPASRPTRRPRRD